MGGGAQEVFNIFYKKIKEKEILARQDEVY